MPSYFVSMNHESHRTALFSSRKHGIKEELAKFVIPLDDSSAGLSVDDAANDGSKNIILRRTQNHSHRRRKSSPHTTYHS
mmetsp:Transcript_1905/g.3894  ORF Transcript_1905/g.3894 Transcript_1905/m.3894 type:complete len:80 (-) Transcript_1905:4881-5120(-)